MERRIQTHSIELSILYQTEILSQLSNLYAPSSHHTHKFTLSAMPNSTDLVHGWVSANCGRGTIDILWSCLVTTIFCVWTAIHLPVPHYELHWPLSMRKKIVRSKIVPAMISIIAPEILTYTAIVELLSARKTTQTLKRILCDDDISLVHGFFFDMGGFCLKWAGDDYRQIEIDDIANLPGPGPQSTHKTDEVESQLTRQKNGHDGTESMAIETHLQWVKELGKWSADQINERANSDTLTKCITCAQGLWFATQAISRLVEHQAVSLLEVSTSAYVFCAVAAYAAWWKKPQGCVIPFIIGCTENTMAPERRTAYMRVEGTWKEFLWGGSDWFEPVDKDIPTWHIGLLTLLSTAYGAWYVAAWNITLPSNIELWLWRACALYCLAFGLYVGLFLTTHRPFDHRSQASLILTKYLTALIMALYITVRVYMGVEILISLRALPHSAYDSVQWSTFVPHI